MTLKLRLTHDLHALLQRAALGFRLDQAEVARRCWRRWQRLWREGETTRAALREFCKPATRTNSTVLEIALTADLGGFPETLPQAELCAIIRQRLAQETIPEPPPAEPETAGVPYVIEPDDEETPNQETP